MLTTTTVGTEAARLIKAAEDLGPSILAERDRIDRERRLPPALVEQLRDRGFFSLWLARSFGGPELSLMDFIPVIEALARFDGSVAWCVTNAGACSRFSGLLPEAFARRLFVEERAVVAGNIGPVGTAVCVPGGYRVTGRWPYASGIPHSTWLVSGCVVHEDSAPRRGPGGAPEIRLVFFPAGEAQVIDTWDVGGLRGTGSHDYAVSDLFVPDTCATDGQTALLPGPLYALPRHTAFSVPIAAVPLGIARGALDALRSLSASKTPRIGSGMLKERAVVHAAVARAEGALRGARAYLLEACTLAWQAASAGETLTLDQRAAVRLACAQVADTAKAVVQTAYDMGGGTAVYESCPVQRHFRDAHAAAQHVQVHSGNFETVGRILFGLEPGTPIV